MDSRLRLAYAALDDPELHPHSEDRDAAKCWLTYRIIDGTLPPETWQRVGAATSARTLNDGLTVRWMVSQTLAEAYLQGNVFGDFAAMHKLCNDITCMSDIVICRWPPVMVNVMRASAIGLAYDMQAGRGFSFIGEDAVAAINKWQRIVGWMNWRVTPMIFVEMRDQLPAIWQVLCIAKACGVVAFKDHPWLKDDILRPPASPKNGPYHALMHKLSAPMWK